MTQEKLPAIRRATLDLATFPALQDAGDRRTITPAMLHALIQWSANYGLDPWQGHTCYMYGKPYVTEKGAMANAKRYTEYAGHACRLIPQADHEARGFGKEDMVWECTVWVRGLDHPVIEYGEVTEVELQMLKAQVERNVREEARNFGKSPAELERLVFERLQFLPLTKSPGKMARARAIRRAHLLAFPLKGEGGG